MNSFAKFARIQCRSILANSQLTVPCLLCESQRLLSNFDTISHKRLALRRNQANIASAARLFSTDQKAVNKVVSAAEKIVGYPTSFLSLRCLLSDELSNVAMQMRKLVGTKHPLLKTARGMILDGRHNMQMRGLLVMLIAKAAGPNPDPLCPSEEIASGIYNSQRSLAEITEVIHTANLIHKGVVNMDKLSPDDGPTADMAFGNKIAVLSGDYFLASACSGLAALGNPLVVENVASAIGDIMTAEFTQFTDPCGKPTIPDSCAGFSDWLRQTFLSSGSLLSKSCQAALMLSGHSQHLQDMAFSFGKNLTYSHQLSKDILPFTQKEEIYNLSLTSAPILIYKETATAEEFLKLQDLWEGGFANYKEIVSLIRAKGVIDTCLVRCQEYRDAAITALDSFPESDAKSVLISMANVMSQPLH